MAAGSTVSSHAQNVLEAVRKLYHDPNRIEKEKASKWLGEFQRSVFAWETGDELLRIKNDVESTYFAAQTIRTKILYSFSELPADSHDSLKESLLSHIEQLCSMSPILTTQLALAVSDLALQMPTWKMPAVTFIQKYGKDVSHFSFLLEILTVLPEEVSNRHIRLGENRRSEILDEMENAAPMVVDLLKACVDVVSDEQLLSKIFKCLGSWFYLGVMPGNHVARCQLLEPPFRVLKDITVSSTLYESACSCVCAALYIAEDIGKHTELMHLLYQGSHSLRDAYNNAVAHEDTDKCISLCRIFTELGESLLEIIVSTPGAGLGDLITLDLILLCNGHCQYEVTEITFNFWYRLSEMLYAADTEAVKNAFGSYIERLILSLVRHCQMEPDNVTILDKSDDFNAFRVRASELVHDVVFMVGVSECFAHLFNMLSNPQSPPTWDITEATLFVMSAVAKRIDTSEEVVVPQVLQAILNLPAETHIAVYHTSVQLVGGLSLWIQKHPHLLDNTLQFLTTALQRKELSSVGAISLQQLCESCRGHMARHYPSLIQLMQVCDELNVSAEASLGLLKGVVVVLSDLPPQHVKEAVSQLCTTQVKVLAQQLNNGTSSQEPSTKDPTVWLDRLAAIFRNVEKKTFHGNGAIHPCKEVIEEIWPVLVMVLEKHKSDNRIVERWCRCIRFSVRCASKSIQSTMLRPISELLTKTFTEEPHSCFLYLGSVLVDEYGEDDALSVMLTSFVQPSIMLLNQDRGLENHPDTVDDLFRLCSRFIEKSPVQFLLHNSFPTLVQCALAALFLSHREANSSVTKFLRCIIECSSTVQGSGDEAQSIVERVIATYGSDIVSQSLQACLFHIPSFLYPDIAELWWAIISRQRQMFTSWFMAAVKSLPTETSLASATPAQAIEFHAQVSAAPDWKMVSYHLRDFGRLYR